MQVLGAFFSGLLLFNAVPHLVQGICGHRHMTPFSVRSGAATNVIWAWINLLAGVLVAKACHWQAWSTASWGGFCVGGVLISLYLAVFWSNPDARLPWHKP